MALYHNNHAFYLQYEINFNGDDMTKLYEEITGELSPSLAKLRKEIPDVMSAFSSLAQAATKAGN